MWSIDEDNNAPETVDWIRSAGRLPVTTPEFRHKVMTAAVESQRQSSTLQHIQSAVTALVAVCLLIVLPAYYRISLGEARLSVDGRSALPLPAATTMGENYEWRLVESFQEFRDQSARALRGTL